MCPAYLAGLIGFVDSKNIQPMAVRREEDNYNRLHHFTSGGVCDTNSLESMLQVEVGRMVGTAKALMISIDETSPPKMSNQFVSVSLQYASSFGNSYNYQILLSMEQALDEVPMSIGVDQGS